MLTTHGTGAATVVNNAAIDFGTSSVGGNLNVTAGAGDITQNGGALTVTGTSSFTTSADDADITLSNTGNALSGALTVTTNGSTGNVVIDNGTTALEFAASTIDGSLTATSGNAAGIIDSGNLVVNGDVTLTTDANNGLINLSQATTMELELHGCGSKGAAGDQTFGNVHFRDDSAVKLDGNADAGDLFLDASSNGAVGGNLIIIADTGKQHKGAALTVTGTSSVYY